MPSSRFDRSRLAAVGIFAFALLARLGFWAYNGTIVGNDDYSQVCSLWFSDPVAGLFAHKGILYAGFTVPRCAFLQLPGTTAQGWIAVQILLSAVGCVLLYRIGVALVDFETGLFAGVALAVLWDTFFWDVSTLSDSLFTFALVLAAWSLVNYSRNPSTRNRIGAFVALGYLAITRPHGIAFVLGWLAFDLFPVGSDRRLGLFSGRLVPGIPFALAPAGLPYVVERYDLVDVWQSGWIVIFDSSLFVYDFPTQGDPGFVEFAVGNVHHVFVMGVLKVVFFFAPFVPRHSLVHILINAVTMLPVYVLGFAGMVRARRRCYPLFRLCIGPVVGILIVTAVTFVSYDFRYRAPVGPLFALACGYFLSTLDTPIDDYLGR